MAGQEALKIRPWAAEGDRVDPDDSALDPTLTRTVGFPKSWSDADGNQSPRRFWNQRLRELTGAAYRFLRYGVEPYDPEVDYPANARCAIGQTLYTAVAANGPKTSNVTSPLTSGQTVWAKVTSRVAVPDAPAQATVRVGNQQLEFFWNCPRDNGRIVTSFDVQWRPQGQSGWGETFVVTDPFYSLQGVQNGNAYQVRTRARNAIGVSPWSAIATGIPRAVRPSKVVGLVATGTDSAFHARWQLFDTGGASVQFAVNWRTASQSYDSTRRLITSSLSAVISSDIINLTEYIVRVRAFNAVGFGEWSEEFFVTPQAPPSPPPSAPPDAIPGQVGVGSSRQLDAGILWEFPIPADGNRQITGFAIQIRLQGENWPSESIASLSSCHFQRPVTSGQIYEARSKAVNALGMSAQWSQTIEQEA